MKLKVVVTVILILLTVITLIAHFSTTNLEFSRYNWAWNGTSNLFAELEADNATDLVLYDDLAGRNDTLLIIIAPGESFSDREIIAIRYFIRNGNTVFIADETGTSNHLLGRIESSIRIQPVNIESMQREFMHSSSIVAYSRKPDPLLDDVYALTLNRPSVVIGGESLINTSLLSWEDVDTNYNLDEEDPISSYSILARERIGNGTLYVFSDPSVFVNGMWKVKLSTENEVFFQNLFSLHQDILVEQTHSLTGDVDSILAAAIWVKKSAFMQIGLLFISILSVAIAFRRRWI